MPPSATLGAPLTCKTAVFDAPGEPLRLVESPLPDPRESEVLVRNEYVMLCRSDLNTYSGKR